MGTNMNNVCSISSYNKKEFPSSQLLVIFLQLVQSRQKRLRNQRKNYCTAISPKSYFGTKNTQEPDGIEFEDEAYMNQGWQKGFMEWRFISDRIHDALQYFDDGYFAECPLPEEQNYKDLGDRQVQPKQRIRQNISFHSISTRLCYCWLIVVVIVIIIIIIVTTWRSKSII